MKFTNNNKYHLPHNSIRVDEFKHMLSSIDITKEYYIYEDLRLLLFQTQIIDDKFKEFHTKIHTNFLNHKNENVRKLYQTVISYPTTENINLLFEIQYSDKKNFRQIFNETIRDYTEFFAFLGLLPTYYKFKSSGEKRHYVSQLLKDYINGLVSLEEILLNFKYRNSSKDYRSIEMYELELRPFVVALRSVKHYFDLGFEKVNSRIIAAIVLYAKDENLDKFYNAFPSPNVEISEYRYLFDDDYKKIVRELSRANLFLKPYLEHLGYVQHDAGFYLKGKKSINSVLYPSKAVYCNMTIGSMDLTPVIGKVFYNLYNFSKQNKNYINKNNLFDKNITDEDSDYILNELLNLKCIERYDGDIIKLSTFENQFAINPYTDFFDIDDANYVRSIKEVTITDEQFVLEFKNNIINSSLNDLKPIALGSNGEKYEEMLYHLLSTEFNYFDIEWLGSSAIGKRLSDMVMKVKIFDGYKYKEIAIVIECKAGKAIRAFDERKEIDDVLNTLQREKSDIDGVWYWVVNGDSLPQIDEHGGYRSNLLSKNFMQKLHDIHFSVSEYMRVPTIVTAFSFDAFANYLKYLHPLLETLKSKNISEINNRDIPHFWVWSKKFMSLQYVMVHKELRLIE